MRRRARHRLIGAAVLVLLGVVVFPWLFDSQPRPVAVDIPIDIPDRAKSKPLVMGATPTVETPASGAAPAESSASAPVVAATTPAAQPSAQPVTAPVVTPVPAPQPKPEAKPAAAPAAPAAPAAATVAPTATTAEADKARALLEGKDPAATGERFVVQIGAYSEAPKLREVRQKLEKSGLKTYTQVVDTKDGKRTRVRVGPYPTQAEADKAAVRIKALDLPAAVLKM